MIPGRLDPLAISRISLVATSADVYNSDACTSRTPTPTITAGSTLPLTSTSDGTPNLGRQSSTTSSVTAPTLTASEVELLACFQFPPSVFPAVGESHKERSLEQSPAYASNYNDISSGGAVMPPPPEPTNRTIQSSFEADYSMRSMDYLYQANFYDYIKDESNVATVARHLNHVIKDYKLQPVACGLRWLTGDWSTDSTVRLLRSIMKEWLPDVAGLLVDLIHDGVLNNASGTSAFHANGVGKLTAGLLKGESPDVSAVFMHSLTETWSLKAVSDLIADVDALLGWNEMYFHQFTNSYIACVIHTTSIRSLGLGGSKQKSTRSIFANRPSEATISPTAMDGKRETNEGTAESDSQKENGKENEKSRQIGENGGKAEEGGSTGPQGQVVAGNLDASQTAESGLGKSATLERLASIYQTNLAVCNYRLALANFKLALLENNIQCDLNRTHALNLAASRHSSFSGSTPNLHFGGARKDEDDSDARNKKSLPKGDIRSHFESLISLRWAMSPDESSPADRMDLTGSMSSIRTLRGLDIASREDHESVRLSTLSGVGQHMASLGGPSTGRGRRRRVSCPGRVCHPFWHVDQEEDGDGVGRAAPPVSVPSTERGSRRSSQVSANSANEVRSTRSRTSDRRSSGRSSYAQSRRSSLRRFVRPPPANFLQPSTSSAGSDRPKMTAQDLTIETLNSLSQPAPNLDTEDSQSQSSIHPLVPTVPNSEIRSTPTGSSSILPAHRTESHRPSQYHYRTFCSGRGTSRTSLSSLSSSSSSTSYDPSDAYNHLNAPGHFGYPIYHYPNNTAFSTPAHPEEYDMDSRSLFSGRNRNHHTPGLVSFPFNTNSSTATGEDQEKSLSEINEFLNTNSRPVSMERLEYRRGLNVPGDSRRANVVSSTPVGTRTDPATCFVRA